jgi:hypothetical protein
MKLREKLLVSRDRYFNDRDDNHDEKMKEKSTIEHER